MVDLMNLPKLAEVGACVFDVQHPDCRGVYHNSLVETSLGHYNHPQRWDDATSRSAWVPVDRLLYVFTGDGARRLEPVMNSTTYAALGIRWADSRPQFVAAMETMGGGGAVLIRRQVVEDHQPAVRYAGHPQGEDIQWCEQARAAGWIIASYSGMRGLHIGVNQESWATWMTCHAGHMTMLEADHPNGIWVEDFSAWLLKDHPDVFGIVGDYISKYKR